jgi:hypothetical protein
MSADQTFLLDFAAKREMHPEEEGENFIRFARNEGLKMAPPPLYDS